ncbi:MAG: Ig-like domain-containing protein [Flavobacteriales bacterium]|nr:Ig-like domain-containing protein [Flavobacteriales bacterium]
MSIRSIRRILLPVLAFALLAPIMSGCNKEKPTTVVIIVKDANGNTVPGAYVKLYANPAFPLADPTRLDKEATTNSSGRAEFDYSDFYKQGQSGFAVLDILSTTTGFIGQGIIKVLEEETNEETVFLEPA